MAKLHDAQADGLTPLVVLVPGTSDGQQGGTITGGANAGSYAAEPLAPDPSDSYTPPPPQVNISAHTQWQDYSCGVSYLMNYTVTDGVPVGNWEAFNEPDTVCLTGPTCPSGSRASVYNNPSGAGYGKGTWNAAYLWYTMNAWGAHYQAQTGFPLEHVAALVLSHADHTAYLDAYVDNLAGIVFCTVVQPYQPPWGCQGDNGANWPQVMPTYWGVHNYDDTTLNKTGDLQKFENDLSADAGGYIGDPNPQVWVTEAGVQLDNNFTTDANYPSGVGCDNGESDDYHQFGACVDGNTAAQASGAQDWINLGNTTASVQYGNPVTTTEVFWYEYQAPLAHFFDSGMADAGGKTRAAYCVLYGSPPSSCTSNGSNPTDYQSTGG